MERSLEDSKSNPLCLPTGVLLCGGRSRRMGMDKAELDLSGEALLDRVITELLPVTREVLLACGPQARYEDRGLRLVLDEQVGAGPLAGIASALELSEVERVLVVACDMPRVRTELFRALVVRAQEDDLDVCWFESERGIEPLCAVYSKKCLPLIRSALAEGRRRVRGFVNDSLRTGRVYERELSHGLRETDCAVNLNTQAELAVEREAWERKGKL